MATQRLTREEALRRLREQLPVLRERFGIAELQLFGSTARDEAGPDSDVDILVTFEREPDTTWLTYDAQTYLEELFGRRVDMVERRRMRVEYVPWVEADAIDPENPRPHMPERSRRKRWDVYVQDMLDGCDRVLEYTRGFDRASLSQNRLHYDATIRQLEIIGEAANRISNEIHDSHPEIPWKLTINARNYLIHGYDGIDNNTLWEMISVHVPELAKRLRPLLDEARAAAQGDTQAPDG